MPDGQVLRYHYYESGPSKDTLRAITRSTLFGLSQSTLVGEIDLDWRDGETSHLSKFDDGVVRFTSKARADESGTLGGNAAFTIPKSEYDRVFEETGGELKLIEDMLGLNPGDLTDGDVLVAWVKKEDLPEVKMPTGKEDGANDRWVIGGFTDKGVTEGIVDLSNVLPYENITDQIVK